MYKKNLKFNFKWKDKRNWIEYSKVEGGMFCELCKKFGRPPPSTPGAWVTKPIKTATELLRQHDKSDWHLASVEWQLISSLASTSGGGICERMLSIGEKEKNHIMVKKTELKIGKPSDTRWPSRDHCVHAVRHVHFQL